MTIHLRATLPPPTSVLQAAAPGHFQHGQDIPPRAPLWAADILRTYSENMPSFCKPKHPGSPCSTASTPLMLTALQRNVFHQGYSLYMYICVCVSV